MSGNENATVVGSGSHPRLAAEILRSHGWSVAAHDSLEGLQLEQDALLVLAEMTLVEAARALKAFGPPGERPDSIAIAESIRPGEIRHALGAGIAGVVLADSLTETLVACLGAVLVGQVSVPRSQSRQVEAAALSTREKQILGLVVMGCMNGEIADRLVVAESTVKSHLSSAFGKLGVRSRNEAVELILDSELGMGMGILGLSGDQIEAGPAS